MNNDGTGNNLRYNQEIKLFGIFGYLVSMGFNDF